MLNIIDDRPNNLKKRIADLKVGDIFESGGNFYIKITGNKLFVQTVGGPFNAFCFNNACIVYFSETATVIPVDAELLVTKNSKGGN